MENLFGIKKNLGRKFVWSKNIWVGIFFGKKKFESKKNVGQKKCRKFFWVKKKLGRKFGLAKFYFGLLRFVCDLLLITAKLNNNNTAFVWVVGGGIQYP